MFQQIPLPLLFEAKEVEVSRRVAKLKEMWAMNKNPGWLGYIGDEKLPRYRGIISYTMK